MRSEPHFATTPRGLCVTRESYEPRVPERLLPQRLPLARDRSALRLRPRLWRFSLRNRLELPALLDDRERCDIAGPAHAGWRHPPQALDALASIASGARIPLQPRQLLTKVSQVRALHPPPT